MTPDDTVEPSHLVALAIRGLQSMYLPDTHQFVQTVRGVSGVDGPRLAAEGTNLRYAAIVALGLSLTDAVTQREVLAGDSVVDLLHHIRRQALTHSDPGAVALSAWATAEVGGTVDTALFDRLRLWLQTPAALPTVDVAWMLTAAIEAKALADSEAASSNVETVCDQAAERLLVSQGPRGIFPHMHPAESQGRFRAHVGCYADQVYPIQALARLARATGTARALAAANACAARIVELQGAEGQWWWHYDSRDGSVVEGFPVYSVHQHAMGPMALFDLAGCGGNDHHAAVDLGMHWLAAHPEVFPELIDTQHSVIWRKVGRREPPKSVRKLNAVTTSLRPGLHLPGLDRAFPATVIDHECRPYELGWLLYAWLRPSAHGDLSAADKESLPELQEQ